MRWHYPDWRPEPGPVSEHSSSVAAKRALPLEEVFPILSGEDRRPLLVLRECLTCTGTDDALLTKSVDNEKTMLMSQWFRCVKLPPAVLEEDHAFHALFPGDGPAHLFVARWDGSARRDLDGQQSRTELWGVMADLLKSEYAKKADPALKSLFSLMDKLDAVDDRIAELQGRRGDVIEEDGPESRKVAKIEKELAELREERDELRAHAVLVASLPLKKKESA